VVQTLAQSHIHTTAAVQWAKRCNEQQHEQHALEAYIYLYTHTHTHTHTQHALEAKLLPAESFRKAMAPGD
jgi:hypothetical protein